MKHLSNFQSFVLESIQYPSSIDLSPEVLKYFEKEVGRRAFRQLIADANFGGLYVQKDDLNSQIDRLYIVWNNTPIKFPIIYFLNNRDVGFFSDEKNEFLQLIERFDPSRVKWYTHTNFESGKWLAVLYQIVDLLIGSSRKTSKFFNPFTDFDLGKNEFWKRLEKMGTTIVSSELQKKRGTLVMRNPNWWEDIAIYPNGWTRALGKNPRPLSTKQEMLAPVYDKEGFNTKIAFVFFYTLRKMMQKANLSSIEIRKILKSFAENKTTYEQIIQEISLKYPQLVPHLPDPENALDQDLVKGANLLNKFGLFD